MRTERGGFLGDGVFAGSVFGASVFGTSASFVSGPGFGSCFAAGGGVAHPKIKLAAAQMNTLCFEHLMSSLPFQKD
jgi:hypothetical protein